MYPSFRCFHLKESQSFFFSLYFLKDMENVRKGHKTLMTQSKGQYGMTKSSLGNDREAVSSSDNGINGTLGQFSLYFNDTECKRKTRHSMRGVKVWHPSVCLPRKQKRIDRGIRDTKKIYREGRILWKKRLFDKEVPRKRSATRDKNVTGMREKKL